MSDLFRSAINYINSGTSSSGNVTSLSESLAGKLGSHDLVGTNVEIGGLKLRVLSLLAEGGYALVFSTSDSQGQNFAMKRQLARDRESAENIIREMRYLRQLTGHPNIVRYVQAASLSPKESGHGSAEFLLLTELCSGGPVIEFLQKTSLTMDQVIRIFDASCSAVKYMHSQKPPIIHRDLKIICFDNYSLLRIENLLFDSRGIVKLCDFGSATVETFQPDDNWNAAKRSQLEDQMALHTTPMYRAPEMLDSYLNYPIGPALDVWALGCILYYLCYRIHPFVDSAKLRILNAKYTLPEDKDTDFAPLHPIIQSTLQIDPRRRPSASDLYENVQVLSVAYSIDLNLPIVQVSIDSNIPEIPENTVLPPDDSGSILAAFKSQGVNLLKTFRESSNKVVQTVQKVRVSEAPISQRISDSECAKKKSLPNDISELKIPENTKAIKISSIEDQNEDFFFSLNWQNDQKNADGPESNKNRDHSISPQITTDEKSVGTANMDDAEACERHYGIRVESDQFDVHSEHQFECDKIPAKDASIFVEEVDLLNLDQSRLDFDQFAHFEMDKNADTSVNKWTDDFFNAEKAWFIPRNVSAPNFDDGKPVVDPLADLYWRQPMGTRDLTDQPIGSRDLTDQPIGSRDLTDQPIGQFAPKSVNVTPTFSRPNYNRANFDSSSNLLNVCEDTFGDLLSSQGFSTSNRTQTSRSLTSMKGDDLQGGSASIRTDNDPVSLQIAVWTEGKRRNLRALLGSLDQSGLWSEAKRVWVQPTMAQLFTPEQVKKYYRKACLVVHPDKQMGTENERLARAIFTELNDAWNHFLPSRSQQFIY